MEKDGLFTFESPIDPAQDEASTDNIETSESKEMQMQRYISTSAHVRSPAMCGERQAIVVVDPVSSGGTLAFEMYQRGYAVISVFCAELTEAFRKGPEICKNIEWHAQIEESEGAPISETAAAVKNVGTTRPCIALYPPTRLHLSLVVPAACLGCTSPVYVTRARCKT